MQYCLIFTFFILALVTAQTCFNSTQQFDLQQLIATPTSHVTVIRNGTIAVVTQNDSILFYAMNTGSLLSRTKNDVSGRMKFALNDSNGYVLSRNKTYVYRLTFDSNWNVTDYQILLSGSK